MSGAGKSTLASYTRSELIKSGLKTLILDMIQIINSHDSMTNKYTILYYDS